jgi:hypothetical protein
MSKKSSRKGSPGARNRTQLQTAKTRTRKPIQFDWRNHWEKKVKPHLQNPLVQFVLDMGMEWATPNWKPNDPPYLAGLEGPMPAKKGTLAWYQPYRQCHGISPFAMTIGVINYPELHWKFASGRFHTVPVGYDQSGQARVVMDILWFEETSAEESIEFALREENSAGQNVLSFFETEIASAVREAFTGQNRASDEHCMQILRACLSKEASKRMPANTTTSEKGTSAEI